MIGGEDLDRSTTEVGDELEHAADAEAQGASVPVTPSPWRRYLSRIRKDKAAMVALGFLVLLILTAIFAPVVAPHDPYQLNVMNKLQGPSWDHFFGTDKLGRDNFSRMVFGSRVSIRTGIMVLTLALIVAVPVGLLSGYRGGKVDYVVMRIMDAFGAIPALIIALAVVAMLGYGVTNVGIALALVIIPGFVRIIRAQTLAVSQETYVEASESIGTRTGTILRKRVLPNVASPLIVAVAIASGAVLIAESSLAVLGFGPRPPEPSWGGMLREGFTEVYNDPYQVLLPGLVLALTVFAFNTLGDGIRDSMGLGIAKVAGVKGHLGLTTVLDRPGPELKAQADADALLSVRDLAIEFHTEHGPVTVVDGVSFDVMPGEVVGLVGESGSGKSVTSLAIMRLLPTPPARILRGSVNFDGQELLDLSFEEMRRLRGPGMAMVFQDPMTSINPAYTVGNLLTEVIRGDSSYSKKAARDRAEELLRLVGIPDPRRRLGDYPHELSGGMRQRVMMAMALSREPKLLIADEPTTALDVTVQAQILDLLRDLQSQLGMAVIFITHDLSVVADLCDRVAVMYAGRIVERNDVHGLFAKPHHPYTEGLLGAIPQVVGPGQPLTTIPGVVPAPFAMPAGCHFAPRCTYTLPQCSDPERFTDFHGQVLCIRAGELDLKGVS